MLDWNFEKTEWLNPPKNHQVLNGTLTLETEPNTDFWQRTFYGYRRNSGHALLLGTEEQTFSFSVRAEFSGKKLYDQAGIFLYFDPENWMKAGGENAEDVQMLGSVVTNHGQSDWAIASANHIANRSLYYRLSRIHRDFLLETSTDGKKFDQQRTFHLFEAEGAVRFGVYACSPLASSFEARFSDFSVEKCVWSKETHI